MNSRPKIYKVGEAILTTPSQPVTKEEFANRSLTELVTQLNKIARERGAVGFAAPQIGHAKRVMVIGMEFDNPRRPNVKPFANMTFINPEITFRSEKRSEDWEGCASFDSMLAYISRPITIRYRAQDINGDSIEGELSNSPARVFQHELDHLDGILMNSKAIETKEFNKEIDKIISLKS